MAHWYTKLCCTLVKKGRGWTPRPATGLYYAYFILLAEMVLGHNIRNSHQLYQSISPLKLVLYVIYWHCCRKLALLDCLMCCRAYQCWTRWDRSSVDNDHLLKQYVVTFSTVMSFHYWHLVWHQEEHPTWKKLSDEVLVWLSVWTEVQMICIWSGWCYYHPIISCFVKVQNGSPFSCCLTWVVVGKRQLLDLFLSCFSSWLLEEL